MFIYMKNESVSLLWLLLLLHASPRFPPPGPKKSPHCIARLHSLYSYSTAKTLVHYYNGYYPPVLLPNNIVKMTTGDIHAHTLAVCTHTYVYMSCGECSLLRADILLAICIWAMAYASEMAATRRDRTLLSGTLFAWWFRMWLLAFKHRECGQEMTKKQC